MFEHLDDPSRAPRGTDSQLAAVRGRGRAILQQRRRTRLATGSAALAATAGVTAVATIGLPDGRAGATADGVSPPAASPSAAVSPPAASPSAAIVSPPAASPSAATVSPPAASPSAATVSPPAVSPPAASPSAPAVSPPAPSPSAATVSPQCAAEVTRLRTTSEPAAYTRFAAGSAAIAWKHPAGPLTTLVVGVQCSPFSAAQAAADGPVREVAVLDTVHWYIGDPASGHLRDVWNADNGTAVILDATLDPSVDATVARQEISRFGNSLVD